MTAEVAVINDTAVALAANSLVTVSRAGQPEKTFQANKLFTFSKHAPVGVMIYGNAAIMGLPWETVIKQFRRELGQTTYDTIEEYAESLLEFISQNDVLIPSERREQWFTAVISSYLQNVAERVDETVKTHINEHGGVDEKNVRRITAEVIQTEFQLYEAQEARVNLPGKFGGELEEEFNAEVTAVIDDVFEKKPLSVTARRQLRKLAVMLFAKDVTIPMAESGVVVAGFGEREMFPSAVGIRIYGVLCNRPIYSRRKEESFSGPGCGVLPFAQRDVVDSFLQGADSHTKNIYSNAVAGTLNEFSRVVTDHLKISEPDKKTLIAKMEEGTENALKTLLNKIETHLRERHVEPLLAAVAVLPKEDLAVLAESLVDLTSIKRKVSHGVETVGGPTDVAVISKGDGFIWIRRKHYFDPTINPHFTTNYAKR